MAMTEDRQLELERVGFDLAVKLKNQLFEEENPSPDCVVILYACCWLLADLIVQAEEDNQEPVEKSVALVTRQLVDSVIRIKHAACQPQPTRH